MCENEKVCSCFGHFEVEITESLKAKTEEAIDGAIADGVRTFLFGGRSSFDSLVYDIVTKKREELPRLGIKRVFCFALENQLRKPPAWFKKQEYESCECPTKEFNWWYTAIYYRNCAMIDQSDLVLFYAEERTNSGAYKAYKYAVKKHKNLINFAAAH